MKLNLETRLSAWLAVAAGLLLFSCKTDDPLEDEGTVDENGNTYVTTDCITPVRYVESDYYGGTTGVTVRMEEVSSDNIRFVCEPGTDINSFLVQVYPLATMYNTLYEQMSTEGKTSYTVEETSDLIAQAVQVVNDEDEGISTGGVLYSRADYGDDFSSIEIDLSTSGITGYDILPGIDYLVVVQACFDDEATRYGDLAICHVESTPRSVTGDPSVGVELDPGVTSCGVTLTPSDDCAYVVYYGNDPAEFDEYIDVYGDDMFHDFMCHLYSDIGEFAVSDLELTFTVSDLTANSDYCMVALAFDSSGTPAERVTRADCTLGTIPEDAEEADCSVEAPHKYAATIAVFYVYLEANCLDVYYNIYPKEEAESYMAQDEESRAAKAEEIAREGFGIERPSSYPIGTEMTFEDYVTELEGNTEYAFIYVGRNEYGQVSDLKMSDSFTTKALVRDNPSASVEDAYMEIVDATRTSLTLKFTYNSENTAVIMHRNAFPIFEDNLEVYLFPDEISETYRYDREPGSGDGKGWLYWFLDFKHEDANTTRWPDFVNTLYIPSVDPIKVSGYDSDTTYQFAYIAEDVNGVLGKVKTCSGRTLSADGGENPAVESITYDETSDGVTFTFSANEDTRTLYYMIAQYEGNDSDVAASLYLNRLLNKDSDDYSTIKNVWTEYVVENGLPTSNIDATYTITGLDPDLTVAFAIPYGSGDTVGELATLIVDGEGNSYTLEEWYGMTVQYLTVRR